MSPGCCPRTFRPSDDVDIVQIRDHQIIRVEACLDFGEGGPHSEAEERWHQCGALFPSLALVHVVRSSGLGALTEETPVAILAEVTASCVGSHAQASPKNEAFFH